MRYNVKSIKPPVVKWVRCLFRSASVPSFPFTAAQGDVDVVWILKVRVGLAGLAGFRVAFAGGLERAERLFLVPCLLIGEADLQSRLVSGWVEEVAALSLTVTVSVASQWSLASDLRDCSGSRPVPVPGDKVVSTQ